MKTKSIIPAILSDDFQTVQNRIFELQKYVDNIQIDFVDGKFAHNTTLALDNFKDIKTTAKLEAHLMVDDPELYFSDCQKYGFDRVIFQVEIDEEIQKIINRSKKYSFKIGLALSPNTKINSVKKYLEQVDRILLLAVEPGFGGQKLQTSIIKKIKYLHETMPKKQIEIDGGINLDNIKQLKEAGADFFAIGSSLFKKDQLKENLIKLQQQTNE